MIHRPRRLRKNDQIRQWVRQTRVSPKALVYPLFLVEGEGIKTPISSMKGQYHYSIDKVIEEIEYCLTLQLCKFLLFGLPKEKDEEGTQAWCEQGIVQKGIKAIKEKFGDKVVLIADVCMCEYTSHGHCGVLCQGEVDNDKTIEHLCKIAVSYGKAGVDVVAPSDMMDGRIGAIRGALDRENLSQVCILAYSVKYASSFYGPFRIAAESAPSFGDRKSYQMDYHNGKEGEREVYLDLQEGADMVMVKPALSYLDVISTLSKQVDVPLVAYSVSGEYTMIKLGGESGVLDEHGLMCETAISIFRAGADILITYFAKELAKGMLEGEIG